MKKILLIHTGGTFGMMPAEPEQVLAPADIRELIFQYLPEIKKLADVDFEVAFNIDSANIQPHHWKILGRLIRDRYSRYDGFVIIHGTDAMVYTATALSFMLRGLNKPVILTGSQRPLAKIRSDARSNLINSVELATFSIPEVAIFFATRLFRGNRTIKISSTHYDAFTSPNYPPLAEVGLDISLSNRTLPPGKELIYYENFDPRVISFRFFPGLSPQYLQQIVHSSIQAVVVEAMGLGNVAIQENSLIPWVQEMTAAGKIVVVGSQNPYGYVDLNLYECGQKIRQAGAISAKDMTVEATIVKLMFLLSRYQGNVQRVKDELHHSLAGEITEEEQ